MIEVLVSQLRLDRDTDSPVVVLSEKDGARVLPILIGPSEANAIAMELAGVSFARPLTHDLLRQVIVGLGASLQRVVITRMTEGTYYAELDLRRDDHVVRVDARPSDSIAIALRLKAPIFTAEELLETSPGDGDTDPDDDAPSLDADTLRAYLKKLDPEDFGKFTP